MSLEVWIDGSCPKPEGPGGWAFLLVEKRESCKIEDEVAWHEGIVVHYGSGGSFETTNNRMELQAAIEGVRAAVARGYADFEVFSDSQYVTKGITEWMPAWEKKNWHKVKNVAHWVALREAVSEAGDLQWTWVPGHVGWDFNERADVLAGEATAAFKVEVPGQIALA